MKTEKIGENIKAYRLKRNMSQNELAAKCSLSVRQIGEIESGNSMSSIDTLENIASVLGLPLDILFIGCDKSFLVYAIDDYLNMIDKEYVKSILNELLRIIEEQ